MIKISIDMDSCQNYGQCVFEAEDIFSLDDNGKIQYIKEVPDDRQDDVENAVDVCPMQAISFEVV
ncbi:MAG: ferredoxin [Candidatus Nanopelagicales bacterium]|jgi:ferredoxin